MKAFTTLNAVATPFYRENVDTDLIIPAEHLKTIARSGLGKFCFETVRYDDHGNVRNSSPFDHGAFRDGKILIAGPNFGCGSSREHAVWALMDLGYDCIIAPSFADIFFGNAAKNGLLLITLPEETVQALAGQATGRSFTVDLEAQKITAAAETEISFEIDALRKERLLAGLDEIGLTLQDEALIARFEEQDRQARPWLY
jgi:3-isopropylmalate/(R)-2-methylmalate dehydratase small subunit